VKTVCENSLFYYSRTPRFL